MYKLQCLQMAVSHTSTYHSTTLTLPPLDGERHGLLSLLPCTEISLTREFAGELRAELMPMQYETLVKSLSRNSYRRRIPSL